MVTKDEIIEAIKNMTTLEVAELVQGMEDAFGGTMPSTYPSAPSTPAPTDDEQTEFDVIIEEIGPDTNKILVIKAVREVTTLRLREAKELVESAPSKVKEAIGKQEADEVKERLEAAGAVVAIL